MKILEVEWVDSSSCYGWTREPDCTLSHCESIGFIKREDKESITLIQSFSDNDTFDNTITIPQVCIKKTRKLKG